MRRFVLSEPVTVFWKLVDDEFFKELIFENNKKFTILRDPSILAPWVVECENKPNNRLAHNVTWKELNNAPR